MNINIESPEINRLSEKITALEEMIISLIHKVRPNQAWYTRAEVAALKGVSKNTLDQHPKYYPNFGQDHRFGGGRRGWRSIEVEPWLRKDDAQIDREYRIWKQEVAG